MITDIKIHKVSAEYPEPARITGLNIDMNIENLKVNGQELELSFTYTVNYLGIEKGKFPAKLVMNGKVKARESDEKIKTIENEWKKNKKIPNDFAETVMNSVNFFCSSNGILVTKAINLVPPMIPPRIQVKNPE